MASLFGSARMPEEAVEGITNRTITRPMTNTFIVAAHWQEDLKLFGNFQKTAAERRKFLQLSDGGN